MRLGTTDAMGVWLPKEIVSRSAALIRCATRPCAGVPVINTANTLTLRARTTLETVGQRHNRH